AFFGGARIDQNRERKRKIDVLLKSKNVLGLAVLEYADVFGLKIANEAFVLVGCREEDVGEVGFGFDDFVRVLWNFFAVSRRRGWGCGRTLRVVLVLC